MSQVIYQRVSDTMMTQCCVGAVTSVPETTFNNMHGKIVDLNTEDARQFAVNQLNEIGEYLVDISI